MTTRAGVHADATFAKYEESGAYHWREIGWGLISHNAFTAERYRQVIDRAAPRAGDRVLDYGCGDGTLFGVLHLRFGRQSHGVQATIHGSTASLPPDYYDRVICTEVIEHATTPGNLLLDFARVLKPGGRLVVTTPIRLTEVPEDPNHVHEWFPGEFARLFETGTWRVIAHEQVVPAAAPEVYFWRPIIFARIPVFRLLCNLLSIGAGVNAMSWLRMRPRLFMMQIVIAEKGAR